MRDELTKIFEVFTVKNIKRKIARMEARLAEYEENISNLTNHGYESMGRLSGKLGVWQDLLDALETKDSKKLPVKFMETNLKIAETAGMFGIPLKDLSKEELMATAAFLGKRLETCRKRGW